MKTKGRLIITLVFFCFLFTMSIGYALYHIQNNISAQATFLKNGEITITSAILTDYHNLQNPENPTINDKNISFNLNFYVARTEEALNDTYYATYQITITNDSVFAYNFQSGDFNPSLNTQNEDIEITYEINGIEANEIIPSKSSKTFNITLNMVPNDAGNFNVSGEIEIELQEDTNPGSLLGSIPKNSTGNLISNTTVPITATIINTYDENKQYNIVVTNDNFELVDINGNQLSTYTINANDEESKTIYIKLANGARFASENQNLNIFLSEPNGNLTSMGLIKLTVPKDENLVDIAPPSISNVIGTKQTTKGEVILTFDASDNVAISQFTIEIYKNNTLIDTKIAGPDIRTYTINNLTDGNYYFKITAEDTSGLTASAQSQEKEYRWTMNVTINITQGGPNGNYTVDYYQNFTTTITANNNRRIPTSLTITMDGATIPNSGYNYNTNTGNLTVYNVTGDLNISGATTANTCLIEGTKVLLADYTYKNLEDIKYNDLLLVWNYETGKLTKEYPIWIEKEKISSNYTKITFSDNSSIGVVGSHAFFSKDYNEFISNEDKEKFHIGSKILKLKNNKLIEVKVTRIETINKEVSYHFVASTRYWNIITNDFITTDAYTEITNLYKFDDNISWSNNRNIIKIDYKQVQNVLPYYLFKGLRAEELGVLFAKKQNDINGITSYINELIISNHMLKQPITKNNTRYWMVTTSLDNVKNKDKYLVKEGEYYYLPPGKWYSTSENKTYNGNTYIQVWTGMHFEKEE